MSVTVNLAISKEISVFVLVVENYLPISHHVSSIVIELEKFLMKMEKIVDLSAQKEN